MNINAGLKEQINKIVPWFYFIKAFLGCFTGFSWADYVNMWSHTWPKETIPKAHRELLAWCIHSSNELLLEPPLPHQAPHCGRCLTEEVHRSLRFKLFQDPLLSSLFPQPGHTLVALLEFLSLPQICSCLMQKKASTLELRMKKKQVVLLS